MLRFSEKSRRSELILRFIAAGRLVAVLSACSLLLLSCASVPPSRPTTGWLDVLPPLSSDSIYVSVDVASSWSLLKALAEAGGNETGELERIIGNLNRVHALIRLSPGESPAQAPELSLIALGKLSPGSVACQLNLDPSWQRVMLERLPGRGFTSSHWSYRTYWRKEELQIAAPERGVLFLTGGVPAGAEALLRRLHSPQAQPLPAQVRGAQETADMFFFIPDPAALAASSAAAPTAQGPGTLFQNLPIRQGWISARRQVSSTGIQTGDPKGYELEAVFLLDQVDNPRSVEMLLRLMLTLWLRKVRVEDPVEILKAVTFRADSESARIESLFLEAGEIASFVTALLPETRGSGGRP